MNAQPDFAEWFNQSPWAGTGKDAGELAWAAWKAALENVDVIGRNTSKDGHRDWWSGGTWLRAGQAIVVIDIAPELK
mgnify:CR=1 FL=1